jgi:chloramphenicol 3-O-phosphotransferase
LVTLDVCRQHATVSVHQGLSASAQKIRRLAATRPYGRLVDGEVAALRRQFLELMLRTVATTGTAASLGASAQVSAALAPIAESDEPRVTWIGVNEDRVDATVESGDRQWRVVFGTHDGATVLWLAVYERREYADAPGGLIVVLNGPSGAGKSLLMEVLASMSPVPWVRFDEPFYGSVEPEYLIWRETAPALHRGYLAGMAALAAAGNRVITAAAGLPQAWFHEAFQDVPSVYIGLDAPLEVLLAREEGRDGRWGGLAEASIGVHDGWHYDLQLDSSAEEPTQLSATVLRALSDRDLLGSAVVD